MTTTDVDSETVEPIDRLGVLLGRRPDLAHTPHLGVTLRSGALESA